MRIYDVVAEADALPPAEKWDGRRSPRAFPLLPPRPLRDRGGGVGAVVVVHQLGVALGTTARQRAAAHGDRELARAMRCLKTPYHAVALAATGVPAVVRLWDPRVYTYHAGAANAWSVGLGIEGRYPRDEESRAARHTAPAGSEARRALELAAPAALTDLVGRLREVLPLGLGIGLITHRQSDADRPADPGELCLETILPTALSLGLVIDPDLVINNGRSWPVSWRTALSTASTAMLETRVP